MTEDTRVLRGLAREYAAIANGRRNAEKIGLHEAVNDLKQVRPVVLIDEIPWSEMGIGDELVLRCSDPILRDFEWHLRSMLYRYRHMPADMVFPPYLPVRKIVRSSGIGVSVTEETLETDSKNPIVSHRYVDVLKTEEDLERLHPAVITYDGEETLRRFDRIGEAVADILPIRLIGAEAFYVLPWDEIANYRGVTDLLMDLVDRSEFMHRIMRKLTDIKLSELEQYEALELFDGRPYVLHGTAALTDDLPGTDDAEGKTTRRSIWGRGAAQIFASVSKEMHEEFDIDYMIQTVGQCGLVYYGCCEPLDRKIDIVSRIPHLRKISITPWADVDVAAEVIGKRYVLAIKPSPASVAVSLLDEDALRREIGRIIRAIRRNGCSADIVLKDISTCGYRPENLFRWERIVMEMVEGFDP